MEMVLERASWQFAFPDRRSPDVASFTYEKVTKKQRLFLDLFCCEVHRVHIGYIDATPKNI